MKNKTNVTIFQMNITRGSGRRTRVYDLAVILVAMLCLNPLPVFAQSNDQHDDLNDILETLLELVQNGDARAIFDLPDHLDDKRSFIAFTVFGTKATNLRAECLSVLHQNTDFEGLQITDTLSGADLKAFLDTNESAIEFSPLLGKFTNAPLNQRTVE